MASEARASEKARACRKPICASTDAPRAQAHGRLFHAVAPHPEAATARSGPGCSARLCAGSPASPSTTAFLWWRRFAAIERDAEAQRLRLLEAEQAATDAKHRAAQLLEIVARRWARTCVDGSRSSGGTAARPSKSRRGPTIPRDVTDTALIYAVGAEIGRRGLFCGGE